MKWSSLLSRKRLGAAAAPEIAGPRTDFQRDFDRIIFSSAFRRMQDKTQVFPLAKNDYVRTRLTHTLEVASVGRSLGALAGAHVLDQDRELGRKHGYTTADFGAIVAAACLGHDIGNPPYGHAGEFAIQEWFRTSTLGQSILRRLAPAQRADFEKFEGNAQGFRVLARLAMPDNVGGMQLTCATLGAVAKYPRTSWLPLPLSSGISSKKHGFFEADRGLFEAVASECGLIRRRAEEPAWYRHPLAFLVEAADDICYRVVDVEDGFRAGELEYREIEPLYRAVVTGNDAWTKAASISTDEKRVEYLRARTIDVLVREAAQIFSDAEKAILDGAFDGELVSLIPHAEALEAFRDLARKNVYQAAPVIGIRHPGSSALGELLEAFVGATEKWAAGQRDPGMQEVLAMVPVQFVDADRVASEALYGRVIGLTDFVAGMTDSFAADMLRKVRVISSLPPVTQG